MSPSAKRPRVASEDGGGEAIPQGALSYGESSSMATALPMVSGTRIALSPEQIQALPLRRKHALYETVTWDNRGNAPMIETLCYLILYVIFIAKYYSIACQIYTSLSLVLLSPKRARMTWSCYQILSRGERSTSTTSRKRGVAAQRVLLLSPTTGGAREEAMVPRIWHLLCMGTICAPAACTLCIIAETSGWALVAGPLSVALPSPGTCLSA
jgi:hypothetical protein